MRPLKTAFITAAFAVIALAPVYAGSEMPMYQFPQANRMSMLPQPTQRSHDVACAPVAAPVSQGGTGVANANVSPGGARYHIVDGKCVPVGRN